MDPIVTPDDVVMPEASDVVTPEIEPVIVEPVHVPSPELKVSAQDLGQSVYEGVQRALKENAPQPPIPTRQQFSEPASEAIAAMDLRDELFDDIQDIIGDAPREVRDEVRKHMRQFQDYNSLQIVKTQGVHKTLADAAIGKAVREGRYVPPNVRNTGANVNREPVHSEPATRIPNEFRREQEDVCRILGVTLTEKELQDAWRNR